MLFKHIENRQVRYLVSFVLFFCLFISFFSLFSHAWPVVVLSSLIILLVYKFDSFILKDSHDLGTYWKISLLLFFVVCFSILMTNPTLFFIAKFEPYWILILWPIFLMALAHSDLSFDQFIKTFLLAGLVLLVWLILVLIEEPKRGVGLLDDPIQRGNIAMMVGLLSLVMVFYFKSIFWKLLSFIVFISGVGLSILSASRGGWLAFFISALTLFFVLWRFDKKQIKLFFIVLVFFLGLIFLNIQDTPIISRINQALSDLERYFLQDYARTSVGYRLEMWLVSIHAFTDKAILGWGFDSFSSVYNQFVSQGLVEPPPGNRNWGQPHNDYLRFLVELGLVGFVTLMAFLLYPVKVYISSLQYVEQLEKNKSRELVYLVLLGLVITESMMEFMLTDRNFTTQPMMYFYVIFSASILFFIGQALKSRAD